jgi:hypothetical protein
MTSHLPEQYGCHCDIRWLYNLAKIYTVANVETAACPTSVLHSSAYVAFLCSSTDSVIDFILIATGFLNGCSVIASILIATGSTYKQHTHMEIY